LFGVEIEQRNFEMSRTSIRAFAPEGAAKSFLSRLLPIALGLAVLCLSVPSYAGEAASVPNFNGLWRRPEFRFTPPYIQENNDQDQVIGGHNSPILKPWTAEFVIQRIHGNTTGRPTPNSNTACWPEGIPSAYSVREIQVVQLPELITIIYSDDQQPRYIYLNEAHPNPIERSWQGHSVGHFEGNTLVVDTVGFHNRPQAMADHYGTPISDGLHVVERYYLGNDGKRLTVDFTVSDPNTLKKPWSMTIVYDAEPGVLREYRCGENNRDWFDVMPIQEAPDF
jgi:hypothetical protein